MNRIDTPLSTVKELYRQATALGAVRLDRVMSLLKILVMDSTNEHALGELKQILSWCEQKKG